MHTGIDRAAGRTGARRRRWVLRTNPAPPPLKRREPLPRERGTLTGEASSRSVHPHQGVSAPRPRIPETVGGGDCGRPRRSPAFTRQSSAGLQLRRQGMVALGLRPCPAVPVALGALRPRPGGSPTAGSRRGQRPQEVVRCRRVRTCRMSPISFRCTGIGWGAGYCLAVVAGSLVRRFKTAWFSSDW